MNNLLSDYVEAPEAAKQLRVSERTLRRMFARGEVPFVWLGHRRIVPIAKFRECLKARELPAPAQ